MSARDWQAFDAELRARVPELAVELLGKPTFRAGREWRWGRKGSLSVVISGDRAGMWFDHEEGRGGWFRGLVGRDLGMDREDANDWIADRIGMGGSPRPVRQRAAPRATPANDPGAPQSAPVSATPETSPDAADPAVARAGDAAVRAARIWADTCPAPDDHPYLLARQVGPLALRMDTRCRNAATLERRRMRDAGILPGMSPVERRRRVEAVLPASGEPWAPPGRCATLWLILAEALEKGHDAAGAELFHERTENGSVRALKLRWRGRMRNGWAAEAPILHLDATLRPELVQTYLPRIDIGTPLAARQPHVRVRQVTGSPTSARALTPTTQAPERDRKAAATRLRDLRAWITLRARQCHRPGQAIDLLVVGQKAAIDALRSAGLPPRVEAVHINALSGLDRWGGIGGMVILGRTLPAPNAVEFLAKALTGREPTPNPEDAGWWYPMVERRVRLAGDRTAPLAMEEHADPIAEGIRWSICEGELIQAMGRGRGVNRTTATPLEIDLLTDVVLPVTVDALVPWSELRPTRRDLMALSGIVLENAADMAACFSELWPSAGAARQDRSRSVTYRPQGAGHRARTARVDLSRIPDPEAWLTNRLGPLAQCDIAAPVGEQAAHRARLDGFASRLTDSMQSVLATRRAALDALSARLEAAAPTGPRRTETPNPTEEK